MRRTEVTPARHVTRDAREGAGETSSFAFAHRALIATGIGAGVALVLLGVWYAADLLLLVFAGVLVSILLPAFSRLFARTTGVGHGLSLALVSLTLLALLAGVVRLIGGSIGSQLSELQQQLPQAVESLNRFVARYEWAHSTIENLPSVNEWLAGRRAPSSGASQGWRRRRSAWS